MAENDDIFGLLQSLLSASGDGPSAEGDKGEDTPDGDPFGGIDIEMIMKLGTILSEMNKPNKDAALINALKPLLREENRAKADKAAKLLKLMAILPLLRDSGMMDKLF